MVEKLNESTDTGRTFTQIMEEKKTPSKKLAVNRARIQSASKSMNTTAKVLNDDDFNDRAEFDSSIKVLMPKSAYKPVIGKSSIMPYNSRKQDSPEKTFSNQPYNQYKRADISRESLNVSIGKQSPNKSFMSNKSGGKSQKSI